MSNHIHIPLKNVSGHITWTGKEPPTPEIMAAFEKMAEFASKLFDEHDWIYEGNGPNYCKVCGQVRNYHYEELTDGNGKTHVSESYSYPVAGFIDSSKYGRMATRQTQDYPPPCKPKQSVDCHHKNTYLQPPSRSGLLPARMVCKDCGEPI